MRLGFNAGREWENGELQMTIHTLEQKVIATLTDRQPWSKLTAFLQRHTHLTAS